MSLTSLRIYRIGRRLHLWKIPVLPQLTYLTDRLIGGKSIPPSAHIGPRTRLAYGGKGVVVHARASIGADCLISPGVIIGGRGGHLEVPTIGDNVVLRPGCMVLGPIHIGNHAEIGPNAVVIHDIPDHGIYVAPLGRLL